MTNPPSSSSSSSALLNRLLALGAATGGGGVGNFAEGIGIGSFGGGAPFGLNPRSSSSSLFYEIIESLKRLGFFC